MRGRGSASEEKGCSVSADRQLGHSLNTSPLNPSLGKQHRPTCTWETMPFFTFLASPGPIVFYHVCEQDRHPNTVQDQVSLSSDAVSPHLHPSLHS